MDKELDKLDDLKPTHIANTIRGITSDLLHITMNGPLLDPYVCQCLVAEADRLAALPPADEEQSKKLAEILVGSYPKREVNDPAIYARAITSIFNEFSTEIAKEAINRITQTLKFLPTRADVFEACSNTLAQSKIAASVGRVHLTEHARRQAIELQEQQRNLDNMKDDPEGQVEGKS
jgi:hypothetical protein